MTNLTFAALLAHPQNGGLRIIAGVESAALDAVVIASEESKLSSAGHGGLALLMSGSPPAAWQQDALIRRVRDRGFVALALPEAEQIGEGTRTLALRIGLTLATVADPLALIKASWQLEEGNDALTLNYVRKVAQSIAYSAEELPDLLRHLSSGVGHGVALIDSERVLLQSGDLLPHQVLAEIDFGRWLSTVTIGGDSAASVRVDSPSRAGLRLVFFGHGLNAAQLSALGVAAEVAMPAVAGRILIDEVADVNDAAVSSGLLRDFIEQGPQPDAELDQRMLDRGWRTTGYHLGFRMSGRSRFDTIQLLRFISRELAAFTVDSHAATHGRGVSGWLTFEAPPAPGKLEEYVAQLRALHAQTRRSFNVATGIGSLEAGATGLVTTLNGAADAARIAAQRSSTGWLVRVETLGLEQLLLSWTENDVFLPAAESLLLPLGTAGNDLLPTLRAYLDNESGVAATAEALGVHRNTVAARIAQAQEILGLDLSDADVRLALHLACRALS